MEKNIFVNIIGDVTDSSRKLKNDPSGTYYFLLQETIVSALNEQKTFPEVHRRHLVQALQSAMRVIETVSMSTRHRHRGI
ncbi:TPA: hypothetical protein ACH1J3_004841 [Citrobacter werkmanii]